MSDVLKRKTDYTYNSFGQCIEMATYTKFSGENAASDAEKIISKQTYKESGIFVGALVTEEDSLGRTVRYFYDSVDGKLLATVNEDSGDGTAYVYDSIDRLIAVRPATFTASNNSYSAITNAEQVEYTYNAKNMLSKITTKSTRYSFIYDSFGNTVGIDAGNHDLATYTYNDNNGKLKSITYGTGVVEEYVYNDLDMISEIWYTKDGVKSKAYSYFYTSDGKIAEFTDHLLGKGEIYTYGTDGRLNSVARFDSETGKTYSTEVYKYNNKGLQSDSYMELIHDKDNGAYSYIQNQYYNYTSDDKIEQIQAYFGEKFSNLQYVYDDFNRIERIEYTSRYQPYEEPTEQFINIVEYGYTSSEGNTSLQISSYDIWVNYWNKTYFYTYDANGNITKINLSTGEEIRYVYDNIGQLIREDNEFLGHTYVYSYDNAGNIISAKEFYSLAEAGETPSGSYTEKTYGYTDGSWGDLLTLFNGHSITYDEIGNPLSYYNGTSYAFTWNGRELVGATIGSNEYSFTYDDQGIRTSKTKDGKTVNYYYSGGVLIGEASDDYAIFYMYSGDTTPVGMIYYEWYTDAQCYWYEKNLHGDVVALYGEDMYPVVEYTYDAWGNATVIYKNGGASTGAAKNPFRYRSYYYDIDLDLYYLNSRYYDSNTGRFLNADKSLYHSMLGYNMFVYCYNNAVNYYDPTGESAADILKWWTAIAGTSSVVEPTPFGEMIFIAGVAIIGGIIIGEKIADGIEYIGNLLEATNDAPKSITEPEDVSTELDKTNSDKDSRLTGEPGEIKKEGNKETYIGPEGKAVKERHNTNHGKPKYHTVPHDHDITWDLNGNPHWSQPHNYWDGNIPIFP